MCARPKCVGDRVVKFVSVLIFLCANVCCAQGTIRSQPSSQVAAPQVVTPPQVAQAAASQVVAPRVTLKGLVDIDWRSVQVIEVLDGDTFAIDLPQLPPLFGERLSVRLRGIETASLYGRAPCEKQMAVRAKQELERMLERADYVVALIEPERGKFFRIVSSVEVAGRDVVSHLLEKNLGVEYYGGTKPRVNWCHLSTAAFEPSFVGSTNASL